jgi:2-aminoethylphosphonate-pyruvate transaminase
MSKGTALPTPGIELAVILAAGAGIRLGALGARIPKGLIRLGDRPIIEESILRLQRAGVKRVLVVTGHLAEELAYLEERYPRLVRLLHNEGYRTGGSLASLLRAVTHADRDFLLLESDLVYEQRALGLAAARDAGNLILVSGETRAGDEVWVEAAEDSRLLGMAKDRGRLGERVLGELTGISVLRAASLPALQDCARALLAARAVVDYEEALVALAAREPVFCVKVVDLVWAEMDTPAMIERVRRHVYPAIVRLTTPPRG